MFTVTTLFFFLQDLNLNDEVYGEKIKPKLVKQHYKRVMRTAGCPTGFCTERVIISRETIEFCFFPFIPGLQSNFLTIVC